jgi:hypothetical protein
MGLVFRRRPRPPVNFPGQRNYFQQERNPMKTKIVLFAVALVAALVPARLAAGDRFQVSLVASALFPADSAYKEVYGRSAFLPELKAAYSFTASLYAWAGYGLLAADGETPVLKESATSRQGFLAAGVGGRVPLAPGWSLFGELGLASIHYREEALGSTVSGSALGVALNAGVRLDLGERLFLLAQAGYAYGKKTVEDVAVKLGGAKLGIGAGIRF